MTRWRERPVRGGMTLVELLVVMGVIALLVALLGAGLQRVRIASLRLADQKEIRELGTAIGTFQTKMRVTYIPSRLRLHENLNNYNLSQPGLDVDSLRWLESCWSGLKPDPNTGLRPQVDWNADGSISSTAVDLEGPEVLVFALGGINDPNLGYQGFSTNTKNPAQLTSVQGEQRIGPFYDFNKNRLVPLIDAQNDPTPGAQAGYKAYNNVWKVYARPYAYFSNYGKLNGYNRYGTSESDCKALGLWPYTSTTTTPVKYWNENSFQIISAGEDGKFGPGGYMPSTGLSDGVSDDNLANFAGGTLSGGSGN